ncbi:hypothetical protein KC640_03015 [Candidatus Dojkabacteria bacterium]|uniref:Uncharacterized protein n=1 Tax=Candidatus Dojkabacteria bacterium TaxID=2099670 RepID=A0A955I5I4_9BACT|nr:hypothetical protein [Candidatus Dojkabacteria bacterium]
MNQEDESDKRVVWKPGNTHPVFPHISADDKEGYWIPDPGYVWVDPGNSLSVVWKPGIKHTQFPNVVASTPEGNWLPAPGYSWADPGNQSSLEVVRNTSTSASSAVPNDSTTKSSTEGCYLFQNQYLDEVTVTFTRKSDNWSTTFKLPKGAEEWECFVPGAYTFTLGSPKGSTNGEKTVRAGDNAYFPIRPAD